MTLRVESDAQPLINPKTYFRWKQNYATQSEGESSIRKTLVAFQLSRHKITRILNELTTAIE